MQGLRGALEKNVNLGEQSWFRCGGSADLVFEPADIEDLKIFLKQLSEDEPLTIIGKMANTIVRDGGVRGCVLRLGKPFAGVEVLDNARIRVGAGALNGTVASAAAKVGVSGLEFLSGVPGSMGGAVAMNAGAYKAEMSDVLISVEAMNFQGEVFTLMRDELPMSYRNGGLPEGVIVISVLLQGMVSTKEDVKAHLQEIKAKRNETQPITENTGGSTFANPTKEELSAAGLPEGMRAWELVDKVGGRGLKIGGAQMSEKHCNFMVNAGEATARDLENLGEELRRRVQEEFALELHWEIKRIGETA